MDKYEYETLDFLLRDYVNCSTKNLTKGALQLRQNILRILHENGFYQAGEMERKAQIMQAQACALAPDCIDWEKFRYRKKGQ